MDLDRRIVRLEGSSNFRDIGGYAAHDGRRTRWGTVYRSGAVFRLSAADWGWMRDQRIAAICDLRSREERDLAPTVWQGGDETRRIGRPYEAEHLIGASRDAHKSSGVGEMEDSLYAVFAELLAPSFAEMFGALAEGTSPLIVHCTAGQDRTGLAIGLLLTILEVPREMILADYALSQHYRRPENEIDHEAMRRAADTNAMAGYFAEAARTRGPEAFKPRELVNSDGQPLLAQTLAAIEARWGSIAGYLRDAAGIGPDALAGIRDHCLE